MKLEERLKELIATEDRLNDGVMLLRACLQKPENAHVQREKLITEALFKVQGARNTIREHRIVAEQKIGLKKKKAPFSGKGA